MNWTCRERAAFLFFELSSYQLDLCPSFKPDIAVLLNVSPDHLDRHGSLENYAAVKERIFQGKGKAVIGRDDEWCDAILDRMKQAGDREAVSFSTIGIIEDSGGHPGEVYVSNGMLFDALSGEAAEVGALEGMKIKGAHNYQNAAAAYSVARICGLEPDMIFRHLTTFPGAGASAVSNTDHRPSHLCQ